MEIKMKTLMKKIKEVKEDDDAKVEHFILEEDDVNDYFVKEKVPCNRNRCCRCNNRYEFKKRLYHFHNGILILDELKKQ